jgi:nitrate reductase gamma subunit
MSVIFTDTLLFIVYPYVALILFLGASIRRYRSNKFTFSSLSSQFLEGEMLYTGSIAWHVGILVVLLGHILAFLFPKTLLLWNRIPIRLFILEAMALTVGLLSLIGLVQLMVRRAVNPRIRAVTSRVDIAILLLLLFQVGTGVYIAVFHRWGSSWYATSMVPYLKSIFLLRPDITTLAPAPLVVKLHVVGAITFVASLSFTRLVHFLVWPLHYLWRPPQVVIWNRERVRKIR